MSQLKLYSPPSLAVYWPTETPDRDQGHDPVERDVIPFPTRDDFAPSGPKLKLRFDAGHAPALDPIRRARLVRKNATCPHCGRCQVIPISTATVPASRFNMPVPGAGEVVGFRCSACDRKWNVG
jgi:hypothetical protein